MSRDPRHDPNRFHFTSIQDMIDKMPSQIDFCLLLKAFLLCVQYGAWKLVHVFTKVFFTYLINIAFVKMDQLDSFCTLATFSRLNVPARTTSPRERSIRYLFLETEKPMSKLFYCLRCHILDSLIGLELCVYPTGGRLI